MFQRHRPAVVFSCYAVLGLALLSWSGDRIVQSLKYAFFYLLAPTSAPAVGPLSQWGEFGRNLSLLIHADQRARTAEARWLAERLDEKRTQTIEEENRRLTESAGLARWPQFSATAARVWARNANDWFHSVLVRPAVGAPVRVGDAAVTVRDGRVVILGQVAEILPRGLARVLLVTDPSSSLSAHAARTAEQGLVEGRGANVLLFNYLFSDSPIQPGDEVITSGLGDVFPEGVLIGRVLAVQEATHESFKRAVLSPAAKLNDVRDMLLLSRRPDAEAP